VGSQQSGAEGQNPLPQPVGHAPLDAAQDTVGLLGCKRTAHWWLMSSFSSTSIIPVTITPLWFETSRYVYLSWPFPSLNLIPREQLLGLCRKIEKTGRGETPFLPQYENFEDKVRT